MTFRRKRGDTKVGTIEATYGVDFGVRSDMRLDTLLARSGAGSLSELLRASRGEVGRSSWQEAERAACARRGMDHVGGPGAPDCESESGDSVVDVKHQRQPVNAGQVDRIARSPWAQRKAVEIVSDSGFTAPAGDLARALGIRLRSR